jgi:nucleotide-binding universal stress UspA family protein
MKTLNKIMVAVDFSDYSPAAVHYAARLAEDVGADLLLVNVINQRDLNMMKKVAGEVPTFSFETYLEETRKNREEGLQQMLKEAGCARDDVNTLIRIGVPYQELLSVIKAKKPDLLIMATKGRSNLVDTIVGSCAHKMFRHSPIPVLSIRGDAAAPQIQQVQSERS